LGSSLFHWKMTYKNILKAFLQQFVADFVLQSADTIIYTDPSIDILRFTDNITSKLDQYWPIQGNKTNLFSTRRAYLIEHKYPVLTNEKKLISYVSEPHRVAHRLSSQKLTMHKPVEHNKICFRSSDFLFTTLVCSIICRYYFYPNHWWYQ
jgi:hypothetical protein